MKNENDTICAVSTAPGVGGIAVIRVSGPQAIAAVDTLWEGKTLAGTPGQHARFGRILDRTHGGEMLDEAVATVFRAPRSFTGEDVVELSVHGSRYVQRRLLQLLEEAGCFACVLEKIPAALAARVTSELAMPTIGIGAGGACDGQVLVVHDMLGINKGFSPRFLRRYADLHTVMTDAVGRYIADVKEGDFPNEKEQY